MTEVNVNPVQQLAIDNLADKFLKTVDSKPNSTEVVTRRSKLAAILPLCLEKLADVSHMAGGLLERILDQKVHSLLGNDLIFNLKRIAFPEGQDSASLNDELGKRRWKREELVVGQAIVFNTTGYVVTSIDKGVIRGKLLVIESRKRKEYISANVPEFVVTIVNDLCDISIKENGPLTSFKNLKELKSFLFELDTKRYSLYTNMCKYLVSSLIKKIRWEGYKLVHNEK